MRSTIFARSTLALCAAVSVAGCVTPGGGQQQSRPSARDDPSMGCFAEISVSSRFEPLRNKIAINLRPENATLEMLADKSVPTEEERRLIGVYKIARDTCADQGASFRASYAPPGYVAAFNGNLIRVNELLARLYGGDISYGEFNRARAGNVSVTTSQMAEVEQQERDANARNEDRRRAAAGAALQNIQSQQLILQQQQQQQQLILQQNRPRNTNCQRIGNQLNCTTY